MRPLRIDAHCHLADPRIQSELPRILDEARGAGIVGFVQGGVDPDDWERQAHLKELFPDQIFTAYGLHPWWVAAHTREEAEKALLELESRIDEADALGELGLDHSKRFEESTHVQQLWVFEKQLAFSRDGRRKPLVLHIVRAHGPALDVLQRAALTKGIGPTGWVHSFSGSHEIAKKYLDLGLSLSICGVVTRKNFETLRRAVRYIPGESLLVETDSPDQPPDGWEARWNEPTSLLRTAQVVAELRDERVEEVLERSAANVMRILGR